MKNKKNSGFVYYTFWICMLILASIVAVFIFSRTIPSFLMPQKINSLPSSTKESMMEKDMKINISPAIIKENPNNMQDDPMKSKPESNIMTSRKSNIPLFKDSNITPTGQFTNYKGTRFAAGIIEFEGTFPNDFNIKSDNVSDVTIKIAFGWKNLPNFDKVKSLSMSSEASIMLPHLKILDIKISVKEAFDDSDKEQIKNAIRNYANGLFEKQLVPKDIINISQQRLAAAYISKNHMSIKLVPQKN